MLCLRGRSRLLRVGLCVLLSRGFVVLGVVGGLLGIIFTKLNVQAEKFRHKFLQKLRLPNVLDVLACTVLTVLLSFILPFMLGCHERWAEDSCDNPDRCIQFQCGPQKYSDLATFFFTLPEETIRILFDRKTSIEAHIPYQTLLVFCVFYFLMAAVSYGMAVPGGLFIPCIIIGAAYGRLVGLAVQSIFTANTPAGETPPLIIPGVYAVLGSASMIGGVTRMTLPITVMMIEITSDAQFLIPIMLVVLLAKVVADFGTGALYAEHLKLDGVVMVFGDKPPTNLKRLTAADIMSRHTIRKLDVIEGVEQAWSMIRDTNHHAFPVTDSELGTLKSIIQKRKQSVASAAAAAAAAAVSTATANDATNLRKRGNRGKRESMEESKSAFMDASSPSSASASTSAIAAAAASASASVSSKGTGVFLGLIQRRHLIYVLTSMPCFPTATAARDSEPMTALPYELQLAQYNLAQQNRGRTGAGNGARKEGGNNGANLTSNNSSGSVSPDNAAAGAGSSPDGLEVVPLTHGSNSSSSSSPSSSPSVRLISLQLAPPVPTDSVVSHALMHAPSGSGGGGSSRDPSAGALLLNQDGASASASFVEWCARQASTVGKDMTKVASGDLSAPSSSSASAAAAAAESDLAVVPSHHTRRSSDAGHIDPSVAGAYDAHAPSSSASSAPRRSFPPTLAPPPPTAPPSFGSGVHQPLGSDLSVQSSMLSHFVNLSPFIDQGAYTVSESISARRVWALFRSLGMRHIVVLNHQHQPVGVITKKDLVKFAVAQ